MEKDKNKRIIFALPGDVTTAEVMNAILKGNGLEESKREYLEKSIQGEETHLTIIRDATFVLAKKRVPEKKLVEILAQHLKTSQQVAEKVVADIQQKLTPYAKEITIPKEEEKEKIVEELSTQELLIEKIKQGISNDNKVTSKEYLPPESLPETIKKIDVEDVEKNAEELKKKREETAKPGTVGAQGKEQEDKYREPIE